MPYTSKEHVKPVRQPWFSCACCPPNVARTFASLGQYIWAQDSQRVYLNLFISSTVKAKNGAILKLETEFPMGNVLKITSDQVLELAVRIPGYGKISGPTFRTGRKTAMGYLNWRPEKNWKFSLMRRPVLSVQILKCARAQEKYVFSGGLWCTVWKR